MASSLGWLCLLSFSPFLSLSCPTSLSPSLSSELKLAFLSLGSFISQIRREQDAGDRATPVWMERHWMRKDGPRLAWPPAPWKLWAEPHPLSQCVLSVVPCGLLTLPAPSTSVTWCHSILHWPPPVSPPPRLTFSCRGAQLPLCTSGLRPRLPGPCSPYAPLPWQHLGCLPLLRALKASVTYHICSLAAHGLRPVGISRHRGGV